MCTWLTPARRCLLVAQVRVHLVDVASRQLVHAFIVATEAALPAISRSYEVRVLRACVLAELHALACRGPCTHTRRCCVQAEVRPGCLAQQQLLLHNRFSSVRVLRAASSAPWLLHCVPELLELPPSGAAALQVVIDGRPLAVAGGGGAGGSCSMRPQRVLLFVRDQQGRMEECIAFDVREV